MVSRISQALIIGLVTLHAIQPASALTLVPIHKHTKSKLSPHARNGELSALESDPLAMTLKTTTQKIQVTPPQPLAGGSSSQAVLGLDEGTMIEVEGPDYTDQSTIYNLGIMANDAYTLPSQPRWRELEKYNLTFGFGWENNGGEDEETVDGLRGHVFSDANHEVIIISMKGTSAGPLGRAGPTAKKDKMNDNILFSCCGGRINVGSKVICDCYQGKAPVGQSFLPFGRKIDTCSSDCLKECILDETTYYTQAMVLYAKVKHLYPNANIWFLGHSLGGALASLLGLTFSRPSLSYESPGDLLAAQRLGLYVPPWDKSPNTHVYHTGDLLATSQCNGALSACYRAGYAMESKCHAGRQIVYQTVEKWGWKVDHTGRSHTIEFVIDNVLSKQWNDGELPNKQGEYPAGRGRNWTDVPIPRGEDVDCEDCVDWAFVE